MRSALRSYLFTFIRERARQRWKVEQVSAAARRRRRHAARSERADDRLRAPLHRLQAAGADLPRSPIGSRAILNAPRRPVQIVFAGKAHPADETGKHHLQQVYRRALDPKFGGRIAFVDDYDLHVAHFLVQGCDVWLNNPRKPLEASGTSGMKASINGVPHLSIGDGWWAEGYTGENGWLIDGRTDTRIPTRSMPPTPRRSTSCSKSEIVPALLRARRAAAFPTRWLDASCARRSSRWRRSSAPGAWSSEYAETSCTRPALESRGWPAAAVTRCGRRAGVAITA